MTGQVSGRVAQLRRDLLLGLQEPISASKLARRVGAIERVLVCARDEGGCWYGRADFQAPVKK